MPSIAAGAAYWVYLAAVCASIVVVVADPAGTADLIRSVFSWISDTVLYYARSLPSPIPT